MMIMKNMKGKHDMKNINTVIFDIGMVLVNFDWPLYIKKLGYSEEINKELGEIIFKSNMWKERDRGEKKEEEYIDMFISQAPHLEIQIRKVFENIVDIVEVFPYSKEWIKKIKEQGKKVYLLSNYSKRSYEHDRNKFDFLEYVDGAVISYEVHALKPEKKIYETLLEKYNIDPKKAIFLDDVEENLEGARIVGIETIHVTSHEAAVVKLAELGIN